MNDIVDLRFIERDGKQILQVLRRYYADPKSDEDVFEDTWVDVPLISSGDPKPDV